MLAIQSVTSLICMFILLSIIVLKVLYIFSNVF